MSICASRRAGISASKSWFGIASVERMPSFSRMLRSSLTRGDSGSRLRSIVPRSSLDQLD
jgi:hypothetical protein